MTFLIDTWLKAMKWNSSQPERNRRRKNRASRKRILPRLEVLEDRTVPSTLTVTNTSDTGVSGDGSLRGEIAAAQNGDTVTFDPSLAGQTITLTSGELLITKSISIVGPSPNFPNVTINGNHNGRVFDIENTSAANVTLNGLIVTGGTAGPNSPNSAAGGGLLIDIADGTVTLNAVTVSSNRDTSQGAGLAFLGGKTANLVLTNGTIETNLAEGTGDAQGGGVYASGGAINMTGEFVTNNTAQGFRGNPGAHPSSKSGKFGPGGTGSTGGLAQGGGLYVAGSSITLIGSDVTINKAQGATGGQGGSNGGAGGRGGDGQGGGIYLTSGAIILSSTASRPSQVDTNYAVGGKGGSGGEGICTNFGGSGKAGTGGAGGDGLGGGIFEAGGSVSGSGSVNTEWRNFAQGGHGANGAYGGLLTSKANMSGGSGGNGGNARGGGLYLIAGTATLSYYEFISSAVGGQGGLGESGIGDSNGGNGGFGGEAEGGGIYLAGGSVNLLNDDLYCQAQGQLGGEGAGMGILVKTTAHGGHTSKHGVGGRGGDGGSAFGGGLFVANGAVSLTNDFVGGNRSDYGPGGTSSGAHGSSGVHGGRGGNGGSGGGYGGNGGWGGGGALYVGGGSVTLTNDTLVNNNVTGGNGGSGGGGDGPVFANWNAGGNGGSGGNAFGGAVDEEGGAIALLNDTLAFNNVYSGQGGAGGPGGYGEFTGQIAAGGNGGNGGNGIGGGLFVSGTVVPSPTVALANTLFALNSATLGFGGEGATHGNPTGLPGIIGSASSPDISGVVNSSDHDLVGNSSGSTGFSTANGDILNPASAGLVAFNPLFNPFHYQSQNGGPTPTIALAAGSPAIDAGDNEAPSLPASDQRGYARIVGSAVDIGAYEYLAQAPAYADLSVSINGPPTVGGGQVTYTVTVTNNGPNNQSNVTLTDALPADTTFVSWAPAAATAGWNTSAPAAGSGSGTVAAWTNALNAGTSAVFYLTVQVNNNTPSGTIITDTASVAPTNFDPDPANNTTSFNTTVAANSTTTSINAPTVSYGSNAVVTVTVASPGGTPTGNVTLTVDNGAPITQALDGNGQSKFTLSGLIAGTHNLSASYAQQGGFAASSNTGTLTVSQAAPIVTKTADDGSVGTLRYVTNQLNSNSANFTSKEIDFSIGTTGSARTIDVTSALPALTASGVYINGLSQGGAGNTTQLITLNGSGAGTSDGLLLLGSNCTVSGLILENFGKNGIEVQGTNNTIGGVNGAGNVISGNSQDGLLLDSTASGNLVLGNFIGTNRIGTAVRNGIGIEIAGTQNTVGGTAPGSRNILAGNSADGMLLDSTASGNLVLGNYVGLNTYGDAVGNGGNGIEVEGTNNTLGSTNSAGRNIISASSKDGVLLGDPAKVNVVLGNYIGTNRTASAAMANSVGIEDAGSGNTLGGSVLGARNIISGNTNDGVLLDSSSTGETVQGNFIGLDIAGKIALANGGDGLEVQGANDTIGGTVYYARNFLSGNGNNGLLIDSNSTGNLVQGNFIGLDITGTKGVSNVANGIEIAGNKNTIGSTASNGGNFISGNGNDGMLLDSTATANLVQHNDIGTDYTGTSAVGNGANGIRVAGNNNIIGGSIAASNLIAHNNGDGVLVSVGTGNSIKSNSIFANTGLGLGLSNGGNNNMAAPSFSPSSSYAGGVLSATGTYTAAVANVPYLIQIFASPSGSSDEGAVYLGSILMHPTTTGAHSFSFTATTTAVLANPIITATTTDSSGDTSEFSLGISV